MENLKKLENRGNPRKYPLKKKSKKLKKIQENVEMVQK